MKIKVLNPFQDGHPLWLGLDHPEEKMIRKVFQTITPDTVGSCLLYTSPSPRDA